MGHRPLVSCKELGKILRHIGSLVAKEIDNGSHGSAGEVGVDLESSWQALWQMKGKMYETIEPFELVASVERYVWFSFVPRFRAQGALAQFEQHFVSHQIQASGCTVLT